MATLQVLHDVVAQYHVAAVGKYIELLHALLHRRRAQECRRGRAIRLIHFSAWRKRLPALSTMFSWITVCQVRLTTSTLPTRIQHRAATAASAAPTCVKALERRRSAPFDVERV